MANQDGSFLQAASEGDLAKMKQLVEKSGVNINAQGQMNRTALHLACLYGKMEIVMYLVEKGANKELPASSGEVPLHLASLNGHFNVVEFLLSEGANWKATNNSGKKPSDYARKRNMKKLFEDAEEGIFNSEENSNNENEKQVPLKKKVLPMNQKMVEELVSAGYARGDILDCIYTLNESREDTSSISVVMKALEKKKAEVAVLKMKEQQENGKIEVEEDNFCKICFEKPMDSVIIPCGHVCICMDCSKGLVLCPMCRNQIVQIIKMFKS